MQTKEREKKKVEKFFAMVVSITLPEALRVSISCVCRMLNSAEAMRNPSINFGNLSHTIESDGVLILELLLECVER